MFKEWYAPMCGAPYRFELYLGERMLPGMKYRGYARPAWVKSEFGVWGIK